MIFGAEPGYYETPGSAFDGVVWAVLFALLAGLLAVAVVISVRRGWSRPAVGVLVVALVVWVAGVWLLLSPVVVTDPLTRESTDCPSAMQSASIRGVPDDSSLTPVVLECRAKGKSQLAWSAGAAALASAGALVFLGRRFFSKPVTKVTA